MGFVMGLFFLVVIIAGLMDDNKRQPMPPPVPEDGMTNEDWEYMIFRDEVLLNDEYWDDMEW